MAKISKALEQQGREGIIRVSSRISDSALHISSITGSRDVWEATAKLTPEQFKAVAGVDQALWLKLGRSQNNQWRDLVQANFELQIDSQARRVAAMI
jgi:hypothetical protein